MAWMQITLATPPRFLSSSRFLFLLMFVLVMGDKENGARLAAEKITLMRKGTRKERRKRNTREYKGTQTATYPRVPAEAT